MALLASLGHLRYLARHKFAVYRAGRALGVPLRLLLVHDLSKFSKAEWGPYTRFFFQGGYLAGAPPDEFKAAWKHHCSVNPHHWEYWIVKGEPRPMPEVFILEMLADWTGAAIAKRSGVGAREWYLSKRDMFRFHPTTRSLVEQFLGIPEEL